MNDKGMLGFPIKISIAFLIISLTVPIVQYAIEDYRENNELNTVRFEVNALNEKAKQMWYSGQGSQTVLELQILPNWHIIIGGSGQDAWSYSLTKGDEVIEKNYTEFPKIRFLGDGIDLFGKCMVKLSCMIDDDENYGILVERI